jgi:hypothetical protein
MTIDSSIAVCNTTTVTNYNKGCRCSVCKANKAKMVQRHYNGVTKYVYELKEKSGCVDCGWNVNPNALVFHHEEEKHLNMNECNTYQKVDNELTKGVFVCPNCHALRHTDPVTKKVMFNNKNLR